MKWVQLCRHFCCRGGHIEIDPRARCWGRWYDVVVRYVLGYPARAFPVTNPPPRLPCGLQTQGSMLQEFALPLWNAASCRYP